ncbi:signal peptidase I, partial [Spirulina sp. 06S082]|uniref:signal peptidase I n=1 Tax=Spirulina sp. 06S082 TaxID=3110248 RepID=UPI002B1F0ACD
DLKVRTKPNQGIWETAIKTLITIGLALPLSPLMFIVPIWATGQEINLTEAVIQGGGTGVLIGFIAGGGIALIQHFALRWVLFRRGRMPWNYAKFLNEASHLGILKQSGGSYRFYHDKLREYLAKEIHLPLNTAYKPVEQSFTSNAVTLLFLPFLAVLLLSSIQTISSDSTSEISLYPTLQAKDAVFLDRITYRFRNLQRNHIVIFASTKSLQAQGFNENLSYVRRVIALPGETLEISQGRIILNNELFTNNKIEIPRNFKQARITLSADEYYVIGNNPNYPNLETFGAIVPRKTIQGQLILRFYPFDRVGFIH